MVNIYTVEMILSIRKLIKVIIKLILLIMNLI